MTDGELSYLSGDFDAEMEMVEDYWDYLESFPAEPVMTYDEFKAVNQ